MTDFSTSDQIIKKANFPAIQKASSLLRQGLLVAMPTETVYGLAADARNKDALKRLYQVKGRPASHPVIVHIHTTNAVYEWARDVPPIFFALAEEFWPGPLTVVLKKKETVPDEVTGGQNTVALRMPRHPIALTLLSHFGGGLAAPSANKFGHVSPTTAQHVLDEFGDEIALILDGGASEVGIESTILDLSQAKPGILRPGMITEADVWRCIEKNAVEQDEGKRAAENVVRAPGSLPSHYAPDTPLYLVSNNQFAESLQEASAKKQNFCVVSFGPQLPGFVCRSWISMSSNAAEFARAIYGVLRSLDELNSDLIIVESPPEKEPEWLGVLDRLERASHRAQ